MQLSEQEIVRREALQQIRDLGVNPFPAEKVEVNFKTTDFTSADLRKNMEADIEKIKGVGKVGATKIVDYLSKNRFKVDTLLADEEFMKSAGLTETIEWDSGVDRPATTLAEYIPTLRTDFLGDYGGDDGKEVLFAGRIMENRTSFLNIQDAYGRIQIYLKKKEFVIEGLEEGSEKLFQKQLHLGDYVGLRGKMFVTQTGEVTVKVSHLKFLAKSLRNLPIVKKDKEGNEYDTFTDPELRYRQRYVDLTVNPHVKDTFLKRIKLMNVMRNYFNDQGWLEVETPILQPIHGGAAARPFATHHNSLDMPLYMRIANELYLKRLIVGGFDGVYEFGKMFRNEGMDRTHNPEFTAMEIYVAYKDYVWMMEMVETLLEKIAIEVTGGTTVTYGENEINFAGPYERLTMFESIQKYTDIDVSQMDEEGLRAVCKQLEIHVEKNMGKGKLIDEIFGEKVEGNLIQPTYITDYPIEMTPLAKKHRSKEGLVERFELFINGKEIANAYSELNDPIDQRERFEDQMKLAQRGDDEAMVLDEDFLRALEYGMPPTSGLGIGIDRLTMMMTNQHSIQEVLFFPQMKAETSAVKEEEASS